MKIVRLLTAVALAAVIGAATAAEGDYPTIQVLDGDSAGSDDSSGAQSEAASVMLTVAAGAGDATDDKAEERRFARGVRDTVFSDTYEVDYIDRMALDEQSEARPVLGQVEFGRWLDVTVTGISDDEVTATVYYVRKQPVDGAARSDQPAVELPQTDMRIVSRELTLPRGESRKVRINDNDGGLQVELGAPAP